MIKKIKVSIINKTKRYKVINTRVVKVIEAITKYMRIDKSVELSFAFVGTKTIRKVNRDFRKADKPTNVISFNLGEGETGLNTIKGEIIICPSIAEKEAKKDLNNFPEYVEFLVIHSFLHILGYDHKTEKERKIMESLEEKIFKDLKVNKLITKEVLR
jgi:probable rRNA maturation factor